MKRNKAFAVFVTRPGCIRERLQGVINAPNADQALARFYARSRRFDHDATYEAEELVVRQETPQLFALTPAMIAGAYQVPLAPAGSGPWSVEGDD